LYERSLNGRSGSPPEEFFATSDETAINYAASKRLRHGCELWERDRFVALLENGDA
jgi:hypothetical protein